MVTAIIVTAINPAKIDVIQRHFFFLLIRAEDDTIPDLSVSVWSKLILGRFTCYLILVLSDISE